MKSFRFQSLIKKYTVFFTIEYPENQNVSMNPEDYDNLGKYIGPEIPEGPQSSSGALMPPNDRQVYNSGGRITTSDRMLYSLNTNIPEGSLIRYKGKSYQVMPRSNFEDFADFSLYECKAVDTID
ncbi:hypothetical protein ABE28_008975 [Peribacillus muralis]|uniref:Phage head-tail adapter protein n=1 Tax=Peribacillus muralis TaxID=264697 RepID=A0A1B3XMP2_9BACI|nr:hypothetical protein [Peribacillus muralis]AOH54484.1 hypothetical protein ABE28_008975 [Peribacillus muralis]